jgi:predicted MPP superfamily phosphohydrolase
MDEVNPARRGRPRSRRRAHFSLAFLGLVVFVAARALVDGFWVAGRLGSPAREILWSLLGAVTVGTGGGILMLARAVLTGRLPRRSALALFAYPFSIVVIGGFGYALGGGLYGLARFLGAPALPASVALGAGLLPFAVALYGAVVGQRFVRRPEVAVRVPGLPADLHGLRVVHLSDIHMGPLISGARVRRLARAAARLRPDIVVVTGDIVNALPSDAPVVAAALASIPAPLGVWACLGNHDRFIDGDLVARHLRDAGVRVLQNEGELVSRTVGGAPFWICGVDDAWRALADLDRALHGKPPEAPALLLAHDPALFPEAAGKGVALTFSGHTHGGQIAVPFLRQTGAARIFTPFVAGLYRLGDATLFVSRGCGTVVPPIRLGAPPEIPTLVLEG